MIVMRQKRRPAKELVCPVCLKKFKLRFSHYSHMKHEPTCSRPCRGMYLRDIYRGDRNPNYRYFDRLDSFFAMKATNVRKSAETRNIPFDLTTKQLREQYDRQNGLCYYSGIPMAQRSVNWAAKNQADPDVLSVDRVIPSEGYHADNIVLCCNGLNKLKGASTKEELSYFLEQIALRSLGTCQLSVQRLTETARLPERSKLGDGGFDLYVDSIEDLGAQIKVGFGVAVQPSPGWVLLALPRSSIYKTGLRLSNCVGLVDQGYTGQIFGIFDKLNWGMNLGKGDRLIQLMPVKLPLVEVVEVSELTPTERGAGGFGSTNV